MAYHIKELVGKTKDLSSIPRTQVVERESQLQQVVYTHTLSTHTKHTSRSARAIRQEEIKGTHNAKGAVKVVFWQMM